MSTNGLETDLTTNHPRFSKENNKSVIKVSYQLKLEGNNCNSERAYASVLQHCFKEGAGYGPAPSIIAPGEPISGKGFIRQMNPVGLREEIIEAISHKSFTYTVLNPAVYSYPVTYHLGVFNFEDHGEENNKVTVHWTVEYIPMKYTCNFAGLLTRAIINLYLSALAKYMKCDNYVIERKESAF